MFNTPVVLWLGGAAVALAALTGGGVYFHHKWYGEGVADTTAKMEKAQHAAELKTQAATDAAAKKYDAQVVQTEDAQKLLAASSARLSSVLDQLAHRPATANRAAGVDAAGTDWIGVLGQCTSQYEQVGKDAARLSDKVNGLQAQLRAIGVQ